MDALEGSDIEAKSEEGFSFDLENRQISKTNDKKRLVKKLQIGQPDQENRADENPKVFAGKCSKHPDEDLQFYCFNKDQTLCSECLVSGKYVGSEISNLRKAAEKLKGKFSTLVIEAMDKFQAYNLVEEEVEVHEQEIEKAASSYEEEVIKLLNEVRQKINQKEKELLESISLLRQGRLNELKSATKWLQSYREEIDTVKKTEEDKIKNASDLNIVTYYANKTNAIKTLINNDESIKVRGIKEMIENYQLQDQISITKFQEECKLIKAQFDGLTAPGSKQINIYSNKQTFRPPTGTSFFTNQESSSHGGKDSRDTVIVRSSTPTRLNSNQKPTFLSSPLFDEIIDLDPMGKSSTSRILERHMAKMNEIRRQTPSRESRIEAKVEKEMKRSESKPRLMSEIRRETPIKRTNSSALGFHDTNSILDAYKDFRTKRTEQELKTTKSYASLQNQTSSKFGSETGVQINLINPSSREKSSFDLNIRNLKSSKSNLDAFASELSKSTLRALTRENESAVGLDIDKMFSKRRVQEKPSQNNQSQTGLKKKLDKLSSAFFK